jgi:hypothetical protein
MLNIPPEYDRDTSKAKLTGTSRQVFPSSLLHVSAGICQRALVAESRMIRTQIGTHNRVKIVTVFGTPWAIPPHNKPINCSTKEFW